MGLSISMGDYLSKPKTDKESSDVSNDKLDCGASSMQGWRISQEDAHNCILDYDTNTSLFAVYDGHGGPDVAIYASQVFPNFLKNVDMYKNGDMKEALVDAFLGFDKTLISKEVLKILKNIHVSKAKENDNMEEDDDNQDEVDEEEDVNNLYEEAQMPIELVLEKYTSNSEDSNVKKIHKESKASVADTDKPGSSNSQNECNSSSSGNNIDSSNGSNTEVTNHKVDVSENVTSTSSETVKPDSKNETEVVENVVTNSVDEASETKNGVPDSTEDAKISVSDQNNGDHKHKENTESDASTTKTDVISTEENGEVTNKGKGKAIAKAKSVKLMAADQVRRSARQLYSTMIRFMEAAEEDDDDDEEDEDEDSTFVGPNDDSDDDDNDEDGEEEEEDDEDDELDDSSEGDDDLDAELPDAKPRFIDVGYDSGCTAVVALLKDNELYVANAGDSRCVVCRNGRAIEMSFDHKPEDKPERDRITKAGGRIQAGRINSGLNLSRAFGDHNYKMNKELSDREQMITALPDIQTLTINPSEDEFMVLACDGIWNSLSSQEVVDFIRSRIKEGRQKLSQICEEIFDHCLAPNTKSDGTGGDNMTAIIVEFKSNPLKRSLTESVDSAAKRAKPNETDDTKVESTM